MMIPTQKIGVMGSFCVLLCGICVSSMDSLTPLRRRGSLKWWSCFRKGNGDSTLAIKQASSFSSHAEGASENEVLVEDIAVRGSSGTKTMELMDQISLTKFAPTVHDQLPPLLSMIIDGLPPFQQSKYVHEAKNRLHQYVKRYQNVISLNSYCRAGLSAASYMHPGVISIDRLVVISFNYALQYLLDDLIFDNPDELLQDQYGISRSACGSPLQMQEYLDHLNAVFSQQVQPSNPTPLIETLLWELGHDMLKLSNPEWFRNYVTSVMECHRTCVDSQADIVQGHNLYFQDLESYTVMRAGNIGGKFIQLLIEFANDSYIPSIMKIDPYFEKVTTTTSIHLGFANDVFSYHKESSLEQNPRNLITVLMECEGKPFVQTVHRAIGLVNIYGQVLIDLEAEAQNSTLQKYLQDIKALIAGWVYHNYMDKRYRHPDSIFPELRGMTSS